MVHSWHQIWCTRVIFRVTVAAVTVAVVVTAVMAEEGVMALGWITTTEADVAATGVAAITTLCGMPETFGAATATNADAR